MQLKEMRRVVTGHDLSGKSVVVFDGPPSNANERKDSGIAQIWATDGAPANNQGAEDAALRPIRLVTPPSGSLFWLCKMAPMDRAPCQNTEIRNGDKRKAYK